MDINKATYEYEIGDVIILNDTMGKFTVAKVGAIENGIIYGYIYGIYNGRYNETSEMNPIYTKTKKPYRTPKQLATINKILKTLRKNQANFDSAILKLV